MKKKAPKRPKRKPPPVKTGRRSETVTTRGRIAETVEILINTSAGSPWRILAKKWGCSRRTADRLIKAARAELRRRQENRLEERIEFHRAERLKLYKEARQPDGNGYLALQILGDLAKLDGVYSPEKHKVDASGEIVLYRAEIPDNGRSGG
jgi:hypothetical protein